jgi:hypothetical protein
VHCTRISNNSLTRKGAKIIYSRFVPAPTACTPLSRLPGPCRTVMPGVPSNPLRLFERSRIAAGLKTLCAITGSTYSTCGSTVPPVIELASSTDVIAEFKALCEQP